ncbi:MAG TPA: hypothetical protein VNQ79_20770 [Blastocatellia bacterium]|nr:hypothetical protein [Blastocatellia bacterium]
MLTGYNTDVPFEGVTYHVQTEDKGLKNPLILSLIYQGGTILGAKRTSYQDLIVGGKVDETRLARAIERQHQIILAAIQGGRLAQLIERLNKSNAVGTVQPSAGTAQKTAEKAQSQPPAAPARSAKAGSAGASAAPVSVETPPTGSSSSRIYRLSDLTSDDSFSLDAVLDEFLKSDKPHERLSIELLSAPRLVAGEQVTIRAAVQYDGQWAAVDSAVRIKIVGTTIKPQTFTTGCNSNGTFSLTLTLPEFTTGTAALIIQATDPKGQEAELKLLIRKR